MRSPLASASATAVSIGTASSQWTWTIPPRDPRTRIAFSGRTTSEADDNRFFRRVSVDLRVDDVTRSHHVPLLLAPYSMTMYRGS